MIHIATFVPKAPDANAWYRGLMPFYEMKDKVQVHNLNGRLSWLDFAPIDVIFVQNPHKKEHLSLIKSAKEMAPVWVDFGDNMFDVPLYNPHYLEYAREDTYQTLSGIIQLADIVTVPTDTLAREIKKFTKAVKVIKNAYNDHRLPMKFVNKTNEKPRVLWRGTDTHAGDLAIVSKELNMLISQEKNVEFLFMGYIPWMIDTNKPNVKLIMELDIVSYHKALEAINPDVLIVPLQDNSFNRCKSDIAGLEVARYGTTVLVPKFVENEWQLPGTVHYTSLSSTLEMYVHNTERLSDTFGVVMSERLLSQANEERYKILEALSS